MKTWIKTTIVVLLTIFSTSCSFEYNDDDYDPYYVFYGKTWSKIIETQDRFHHDDYYYFECYEFHRDGTYTYWYYEDDVNKPSILYSVENGHWEVISNGSDGEIRLYSNGCSDAYCVNDFINGFSDNNSYLAIDDYKAAIDDLYYHDHHH